MTNTNKSKNTRQMLFIAYNTINYPIYYAFQISSLLHKTITFNDIINNKILPNKKLPSKSEKNIRGIQQKRKHCLRSVSQALISPLIVLLLPVMISASTQSASSFFGSPGAPLIFFSGRHHFQYPWGEQKLQRHNMKTFIKRSEPALPMNECLQNTAVQRAATALLADLPATSISEDMKRQRRAETALTETGVECPNDENIREGVMNEDDIREIKPGMPMEMRSICPFFYVENVNERRLPRRITEVRCLCERPPRRQRTHHTAGIHCEPLHFSIPVLLFEDEQCSEPKRSLEQVTLGCVAVHGASSRSGFLSAIGQPRPLIVTEQQF
ncbi:unnamed protein product [Meloidogyne enterolobii]|uniref:Uncharacterized protein n=1 Tax=Meloidogyne enterolobii TaxID=390850 RepID=A0ACB1A159_MELEN